MPSRWLSPGSLKATTTNLSWMFKHSEEPSGGVLAFQAKESVSICNKSDCIATSQQKMYLVITLELAGGQLEPFSPLSGPTHADV